MCVDSQIKGRTIFIKTITYKTGVMTKSRWLLKKKKKKNQLEIMEMKRSYSEIKDDVTICLKYPLLRKWTRELSFQSGENSLYR